MHALFVTVMRAVGIALVCLPYLPVVKIVYYFSLKVSNFGQKMPIVTNFMGPEAENS